MLANEHKGQRCDSGELGHFSSEEILFFVHHRPTLSRPTSSYLHSTLYLIPDDAVCAKKQLESSEHPHKIATGNSSEFCTTDACERRCEVSRARFQRHHMSNVPSAVHFQSLTVPLSLDQFTTRRTTLALENAQGAAVAASAVTSPPTTRSASQLDSIKHLLTTTPGTLHTLTQQSLFTAQISHPAICVQ